MSSNEAHNLTSEADSQIDALARGEISADDVLEIRDITRTLKTDINDTDKDIFTAEDKTRWENELRQAESSNDLNAIKNIAQAIAKEKKEIQQITRQYTATIQENEEAFTKDDERGLNTAKEYIEEFKELAYESSERKENKRQRFEALKQDVRERLQVIEQILHLDPERAKQLKTMRRSERAALLEDLNKNMKPHEKLMGEFMAFPFDFKSSFAEYRMSRAEFKILPLEEKQEIVDGLSKKLHGEYEKAIEEAKKSKAFSAEEIKQATDHFTKSPIGGEYGKANALIHIKSHLKKAHEVVFKFEGYLQELPPENQQDLTRQFRKNFYEADFQRRTELCTELMARIDIFDDEMNNRFLDLLEQYRGLNTISAKEQREQMLRFMLKPLKEKPTLMTKFETEEIPECEQTLNQFRASLSFLPSEKRQSYIQRFKEANQMERKAVLGEVFAIEGVKYSAQKVANDMPTSMSEDSLKAHPNQEDSKEKDRGLKKLTDQQLDEKIQEALKTVAEASQIRRDRQIHTALEEETTAAKKAELANGHQSHAEKRTHHLDTAEQAALQEELAKKTKERGHKKVLKRDKNNGALMAKDVTQVDRGKLANDQQRLHVEKEATRLQRTDQAQKAAGDNTVEIVKDGQVKTADYGQEQLEAEEDEIRQKMAEKAEDRLGLKTKQDQEKVQKAAEQKDLTVKLEFEIE